WTPSSRRRGDRRVTATCSSADIRPGPASRRATHRPTSTSLHRATAYRSGVTRRSAGSCCWKARADRPAAIRRPMTSSIGSSRGSTAGCSVPFATTRRAVSTALRRAPSRPRRPRAGAGRPPRGRARQKAYSTVPLALNPRVFAASEASAIQSIFDLNGGQVVGQQDQGAMGNSPIKKVPDLIGLGVIPPSTVEGAFGTFLNKNGQIGMALSFVAMSVGQPGPTIDGILTWKDILNGPLDPGPDLGPPPTMLPPKKWGMDKEVTRLDRVLWGFFAGQTNFSDWYYPSSGLSTTTGINLDSTALSAPPPVGRGRCDIENLTEAANVDVPVIAFGGSAGNATVPAVFSGFAQSIGTCLAASCDGSTP